MLYFILEKYWSTSRIWNADIYQCPLFNQFEWFPPLICMYQKDRNKKTTHEKPCLKTTGPRPKTNYRLQVHRNIKKVLSNRFAFKLSSSSSSSSIFYLFSRLNSDHGVEYRNQICLKDRSFIRIINLQIWLEYPPKQNLLLIVILMFWLAAEFVDCYIVLPYQALNYRNRICSQFLL